MSCQKIIQNEKGAVLAIGLMFLVLMLILGTTAYMLSNTDVRISANYKYSEDAFNDSDAGVQYAIAKVEAGLENGTYTLPASVGSSVPIIDTANGETTPTGFDFTLSNLSMTASNRYSFTSTGSGPQGATAEIDAVIKRGSAIDYAAFGDVQFDGKANANVFSYDHRDAPNNQPGDASFTSTGEGDIGSNGEVELKNGTYIDGDVALGNDGSTDAVTDYSGTPVITGEDGVLVGRVDPDPLNVGSPSFDQKFVDAQATNNNAAIGGITVINNPGAAINIPCVSGATTVYYFTGIELGNSDVITIDGTCGDVEIYVEGNVNLKNGSIVNVSTSGDNEVNFYLTGGTGPDIWKAHNGSSVNVTGEPTNFGVFTDSTFGVRFHNSSDTKALIYAPFAEIELDNSGDVYGAFWGSTVIIKNSGDLYYDVALKDKYFGKDVQLATWKQELY